jgi:hypothetical protein
MAEQPVETQVTIEPGHDETPLMLTAAGQVRGHGVCSPCCYDNLLRRVRRGVISMAASGAQMRDGSGVRTILIMVAVAGLGAFGCGSSGPVGTPHCVLNSDCKSPLVCALGYCVDQCTESRDCPAGQRCVSLEAPGDAGAGSGDGGVATPGAGLSCQPTDLAMCQYTSQCRAPLVCALDQQCRNQCLQDLDCPKEQKCTSVTHLCADPTVDKDYDPATNEFKSTDAGAPDRGTTPPRDAAATGDAAAPGDGAETGDAPQAGDMAPHGDADVDQHEAGAQPDAATGPLGFIPSNFNATTVTVPDAGAPGIDWTNAPDAMVSTTCTNCLPMPPATVLLGDGSLADLYALKSLLIGGTAGLRLTGPRPIILVVLTTVDIQGAIMVNGLRVNDAGPGGFSGSMGGPGVGQTGGVGVYSASNSGGGSYCGVGGSGFATAPPAAAGGRTYGTPELMPLLGGSSGGGAPYGGSGGGAIQIVAGSSITVRTFGSINAGGGGYVGGGSGGAILLEAPTVSILGAVAANGGAGQTASNNNEGLDATPDDQPAMGGGNGSAGALINGSDGVSGFAAGGGGAGRIRINTVTGAATVTGIISPSLSPVTPCATQGRIAM